MVFLSHFIFSCSLKERIATPKTMRIVPIKIGIVTISPKRSTAANEENKLCEDMTVEDKATPTFLIAKKLAINPRKPPNIPAIAWYKIASNEKDSMDTKKRARNPKRIMLVIILNKDPVHTSDDRNPFFANIEPMAQKNAVKIANICAIMDISYSGIFGI